MIKKINIKSFIIANIGKLSLLLIVVLLLFFFNIVATGFLRIGNITNILRQTSILSLVSIGMTFVMIVNGIDLSVGSNLALGSAIGVIVMNLTGSPYLGIIVTIATCTTIGLLNGVIIGKFGISPLMTTLATMFLARGLTIGVLDAISIGVNNRVFLWLGQMDIGRIPVSGIFALLLFIIFYFVLNKTSLGLKMLATGGNEEAANASGINVKNVRMYAYILTGLLVGLASVITVGRLSSAQPYAGLGLEFEVITAVVIGGTSLKGGQGTIFGTFLGAIIMGILASGLSYLALSPFYQYIFRGFVIIIVVFIDSIIHKKQ